MSRIRLLIVVVLTSLSSFAQQTIHTQFVFHNNGQPFALNDVVPAFNGVDYSVQSMAFYMSRVQITHDGGQVTPLDTNEVFYINFNNPEVILGSFPISNIEAITFDVGVPEYLNHLDISLYHGTHPLSFQDPSMHWGWASGYMHMVMNGKGDDNNDGTPTVAYELNCLGDGNVPTASISTTATDYSDHQTIVLICNVDQWLRETDPATTGAEHGSTGINITVMNNVENYPVFTSPLTASVIGKEQIEVTIAQSVNTTTVSWNDAHVTNFRLIDAEGRVIDFGTTSEQKVSFSSLTAGMHIAQLFNDKNSLIGTAKWIVP